MTYESYAYIRDTIKNQIDVLDNNYRIAINFIPSEPYNSKKPSGIDKAHQIYMKEYSRLRAIQKEFHRTVQHFYKEHPNIEMRKFWGLTE
jgi:hypothetical protein